jgi:beta propeller repeat protein
MKLKALILIIFAMLTAQVASAELPADAACAKVKIEISQELTLERIAFDAKMVITNNMPEKDITGLEVDISILNTSGGDAGSMFYIALPTLRNITGVDGNGVVSATEQAEIHWLIIPSPGAGGMDSAGTQYWVGATLKYDVDGNQEVVNVNPDVITVRPEAQLVLDYFIPYKVLGDNPFTPEVEPPVPFPLAVRVLNDGYGSARALAIESAKPRITENEQGLLIDFQLLGASVNDSYVEPSLTVDIGDLPSNEVATAFWEMQSTLSGKFIDFEVNFTHDPGLGGELTSLIRETNSYYFTHFVKVNLADRDARLDILADTDGDVDRLPDTIYESEVPGNEKSLENSKTPVEAVDILSVSGRPTPEYPEVEIEVSQAGSGWIFARLLDPSDGLLDLLGVKRSDGVLMDTNNFWATQELNDEFEVVHKIQFVDYRSSQGDPTKYYLVYQQPDVDLIAPITELSLNGPSTILSDRRTFITPETSVVLRAEDNAGGSGVKGMYRSLDGEDFIPALPFTVSDAGEHTFKFYSTDREENSEEINTVTLIVDVEAPVISAFSVDPETFAPSAPSTVSAPTEVAINVQATDELISIGGTVEVVSNSSGSEEVVYSTELQLVSGQERVLVWDGLDINGEMVSSGDYILRLTLSDGLDGAAASHTSTTDINLKVQEWFASSELSASDIGEQLHPSVSGDKIVWQDNSSGNWDIYYVREGGSAMAIATGASAQERPSISGDIVVWQDDRNGTWDIYGMDLSNDQEIGVHIGAGNQEQPVVNGNWVAWQDNSLGNWNIYIHNLSTGVTRSITSHERDQMHPALSAGILVWEDYRHGLGDIYSYDLTTQTESRVTYNIASQTMPSIHNGTLLWTDLRDGDKDIYVQGSDGTHTRFTYESGGQYDASIYNGVIVYTHRKEGSADLAFFSLATGTGGLLTSHPSSQEESSMGDGFVVWQDNRSGRYQINIAALQTKTPAVQYTLRKGFNLIAVGESFVAAYPTSKDLIDAGLSVQKLVTFSAQSEKYIESSSLVDFAIRKGMGLGVYASDKAIIEVAEAGEKNAYTLLSGLNYIGIASIQSGYSSYDLMRAVGLDNIQSIRRFNNLTGAWETAAVDRTATDAGLVGVDFQIIPGEGLVVTMKNRVDGWTP